MSKKSDSTVETVTIVRRDGSGERFKQNQREDEFTNEQGDFWYPMQKATEERKVDAMKTRETIRKAGLLP